MFRGTTIEELINSVCRAEEHARRRQVLEEHEQVCGIPAIWEQQPQYDEVIGVA